MATEFDFARLDPAKPAIALAVSVIYHVHGDAHYEARRLDPDQQRLVAVYTVAGQGTLQLAQKLLQLLPDTLAIVRSSDIRHYGTDPQQSGKAKQWHFWWFEFHSGYTAQPAGLWPLDQVIELSRSPNQGLCEQALAALQDGSADLASSLAGGQLAFWLHSWQTRQRARQSALFLQAVRLLKEDRCQLPLRSVADALSISERTLRNLFDQHAGCSPARYRQRWRMIMAAEWLRLSSQGISDIADQLGFTSVAVFSRAFRKYYGCSPRAYRNGPRS